MFSILVVDDEEKNLRAIRRIFFDVSDCELKYADNGPDALQLAEDFAPDVILLDIMMPHMDGYEVCRKIKSNPKTSESMVLFLSGKIQLNDRLKGYEALADDYITKPYEAEELMAKVRILLRLKQAQDELRETNQNLEKIVVQRTRELIVKERQAIVGRMVHGIIHNLQNPLMVADGFARFVEEKIKLLLPYSIKWPSAQQQTVERVNSDIKNVLAALGKIQELIESLLQKGRKEATVKHQKLNLNDLIASEVRFLEADPEFKSQVIKQFQMDPHLPEYFGNYADFTQICSNMIKNAVDAMRQMPTKKITIITKYDTENIYIYFKDTGRGISAQVIDQIFEPFFSTKTQLGDEIKEEPTGTGLGLYTCQELMKTYNGTITVSSELQVGTTFTVTLPYILKKTGTEELQPGETKAFE